MGDFVCLAGNWLFGCLRVDSGWFAGLLLWVF